MRIKSDKIKPRDFSAVTETNSKQTNKQTNKKCSQLLRKKNIKQKLNKITENEQVPFYLILSRVLSKCRQKI